MLSAPIRPPDTNMTSLPCTAADRDVALRYTTIAATADPINSREPAAGAAGANPAKIAAPIIDPRPISAASNTVSRRCNHESSTDATGWGSRSGVHVTTPTTMSATKSGTWVQGHSDHRDGASP